MRRATCLLGAAAVLAAGASCATLPPPIPVAGTPDAMSALAGRWSGDYFSTQTGRHGSIVFNLASESDTAFGDVLMIPRREMEPVSSHESSNVPAYKPPSALRLSFVRAAGDSVYGLLDPYEDPECGCTLLTQFAGRLRGNEIAGTYRSQSQQTGETSSGEWRVSRKP